MWLRELFLLDDEEVRCRGKYLLLGGLYFAERFDWGHAMRSAALKMVGRKPRSFCTRRVS